jgi:hypothetical protein
MMQGIQFDRAQNVQPLECTPVKFHADRIRIEVMSSLE